MTSAERNTLDSPLLQHQHLPTQAQPAPNEVIATISRHTLYVFENITVYYQRELTPKAKKMPVAFIIDSNTDLSVIDEKIKSITMLALATIILFSLFNVVNNWFSLLKVLPELPAIFLGSAGTIATPICCTASKAISLLEVGVTLTDKQQAFFDDIRPRLKKFIKEIKKLPTQEEREQRARDLMPIIQISKETYLELIKDDAITWHSPSSWLRHLLRKEVTAKTTFEYALEILVRELSEDYPLKLIICIGQGPTQKLWDFIHQPDADFPTTDIAHTPKITLTAGESEISPLLIEGRRWIFFGDQPANLLLPTWVQLPINATWFNWISSGKFIKDFFTKGIPFFCLRVIPYVITILQAGQSAVTIMRKLAKISPDARLTALDAFVFFSSMIILGWPKARTNDPFKGVPAVDKLEDLSHSFRNHLPYISFESSPHISTENKRHISIKNLPQISIRNLCRDINTWVENGFPIEPLLRTLTLLLTFILSAGPIAAVIIYYGGLGLFFSESGLITLSRILTIPIDNDSAKTFFSAVSDVCAFSFAAQGILTQCADTGEKFYEISDKLIKSLVRQPHPEESSGNTFAAIITATVSLFTYLIDKIVLSFLIDSALFGVNAAFGTEVMGERISLAAHTIHLCMLLSGAFVGISSVLFSIVRYEKTKELLHRFTNSFSMESTCNYLYSFFPCVKKANIGDIGRSGVDDGQLQGFVENNHQGHSLLNGSDSDDDNRVRYQTP